MGKNKTPKDSAEMLEPSGLMDLAARLPSPLPRWGFGFEPCGTKWRAYKTSSMGIEYLTQEKGKELHSVVAEIKEALAAEVTAAIRGKTPARKGAA